MVRSFDWRDLRLMKALDGQAVCLDAETGLTRGAHPLKSAVLAYLTPGVGAPTLVWRHNGTAVIGQLRHRRGQEQARLLFIAPPCSDAAAGWPGLLDRLAAAAGSRGAHNLIAEVDENSEEFEAMRGAGFAIYARQSLWRLAGPVADTGDSLHGLRPAVNADQIGISTLYANIVPRLVQQVEPPPQPVRGYVLEDGGEIIAYIAVRRGSRGFWVEPYLHPEAIPFSEAALRGGLSLIPNPARLPVFVCVRRYQDWLQDILARAGLEGLGSQAVMVKRLTARISEPWLKPLPAIEGQAPTPVVRARVSRHK